ncbi:MAG: cytochrome c peroxidase [Planctomycetota bacterium]
MRVREWSRGRSLYLLAAGLGVLICAPSTFGFQADHPETPATAPASLKTIPVPLPDDLANYVTDIEAARRLGKALFWDMQVGSDGILACASCHYHAGADNRFVNQIAPDQNNLFHETFTGGGGPNYTLNAGDFPLHRLLVPDDNASEVVSSIADRVTSQGAFLRDFVSVNPGLGIDNGLHSPDGIFNVGDINTRRVEPRQAPSVINAVLLHRVFWDGRANHFFNGRNPFGDTDPDAKILVRNGGGVVEAVRVLLNNAAAASQATGPVLSNKEMSHDGRDWDNVGKKLVPARPLATQLVHAQDSSLGALSASPADGLLPPTLTYGDMIKAAFASNLWDQDGDGDITNDPSSFDGFRQVEKNFSFFFGLAVLCYESTLISDDSPFDRYQDGGGEDGTASDELTPQQKEGLDIFLDRGACIACHAGPEFAGAAISQLVPPEGLLERMLMEDGHAGGDVDLRTPINPAQVDPEEPPEPPHPGEFILNFDPRAKLVEIRPPGGSGAPIALGISTFSVGVGHFVPPIDERRVLPAGNGVPDPAAIGFAAEMRFRNDAAGNMRFTISMEWQYPGLPAGDYPVFVAGTYVGSMSMRQVKPPAVYDNGFYNIGVRPTNEDLGNGASGPFGPFALVARAKAGEDVDNGFLQPPVGPNERIAVNGAFKAPSVRNIELTGPFMHNGGLSTLEQVVDFYTGGAHFFEANLNDLDPEVGGMGGMSPERKAALVAFLKALTDDRVRFEKAPFDHPEIRLPNGHPGDTLAVEDLVDNDTGAAGADGRADDVFKHIPAVGANGGPALEAFETQLPAAITALPATNLSIEEVGVSATARIALDRAPQAPVTVQLAVTDPSEATLSATTLVFTPQNWSTPQNVQIQPVQDMIADGNQSFTVVTSDAQSADGEFAGLPVADFHVTNKDSGDTWTYKYFEAESGVVSSPMVVLNSPQASGGKYIVTPNGAGNQLSSGGFGGLVKYTFDVPRDGEYVIWGLASARSTADDSFWVKLDGGAITNWTVARQTGVLRLWDTVNDSAAQDPIRYQLTAGTHILRIKHREDGAMLDRLLVTNDLGFTPPAPQ